MAFTPALLAAWQPRLIKVPGSARPAMDVAHSFELVTKLAAEIGALGFSADVAQVAAGAFVNCQSEADFGLTGTHNADPLRATHALEALRVWAAAQVMRKAA